MYSCKLHDESGQLSWDQIESDQGTNSTVAVTNEGSEWCHGEKEKSETFTDEEQLYDSYRVLSVRQVLK